MRPERPRRRRTLGLIALLAGVGLTALEWPRAGSAGGASIFWLAIGLLLIIFALLDLASVGSNSDRP